MKTVSILGSTGSIGLSTLSVIDSFPDKFVVAGLAAGRDIQGLARQVAKYRPRLVSLSDESKIPEFREHLGAAGVEKHPEIAYGDDGLVAVSCLDGVNIVVSATVGAVGFVPTYRALSMGRRVCLAN